MFNGKYISLREVIYRLKRHPLLASVEVGDIAYDALDVLKLIAAPLIYPSKFELLTVTEFRAELPCDMLSIISAGKVNADFVSPLTKDTSNRAGNHGCVSIAGGNSTDLQTYSIKRGYIYFDFEDGQVEINYKGIALDADGYPMIPDNTSVIKAIENYVKINHFGIKVDLGEMPAHGLQRAEREYAWYVGQAQGALTLPDVDEMESIKNSLIRIIHATNEHDYGFKYQSVGIVGSGSGNSDSVITASQANKETPILEMIFNFGAGEIQLAKTIVSASNAGLYDKLLVDSNGTTSGVININGTDTGIPFTLATGDEVIPKRQGSANIGWIKISN